MHHITPFVELAFMPTMLTRRPLFILTNDVQLVVVGE